jgi:hypothetical protein
MSSDTPGTRLAWLSRMSIWTRGALGIGLAASIILGSGRDEPLEEVRLDPDVSALDLAGVLVDQPGAALNYSGSHPPTREIVALLERSAERGSAVSISVPGSLPRLEVHSPVDPIAQRRASLEVTVRGEAGEAVPVVVADATGAADTFNVQVGPSGTRTASVAVEPTRGGPAEWTVEASGQSITTRAWTRRERTLRVLMISGPPSWESRYLARALEASGAAVSVRQSLGREMTVTTDAAAAGDPADALDEYDVIALVGPVSDSVIARDAETTIGRWVTERGGGLLMVGTGTAHGALGAWSASRRIGPIDAGTIQWGGPAEILKLPEADLEVEPYSFAAAHPGVRVAWSSDANGSTDRTHATAGWMGRGRVFSSGLDTWPWAMEAGLVQEHVDWWESVVEWLAGGLRSDTQLVGPDGAPGLLWRGDMRSADGGAPTPVHFVPVSAGGRSLSPDDEHGAVVVPPDDRPSWVSAALMLGGSGGAIQAASAGSDLTAGDLPGSSGPPWFPFLALALLATTAWTGRRLAGER